jgi:hypothetical protein
VVVRYLGSVVRVEVDDGSPEMPRQRGAGIDDVNGRGLVIVDSVAKSWGFAPTPSGKRVWFEVEAGTAPVF